MKANQEERLVQLLDGQLPHAEREQLLDELENNPELSAALREAAAGWGASQELQAASAPRRDSKSRASGPFFAPLRAAHWIAAAALAVLSATVGSLVAERGSPEITAGAAPVELQTGLPERPDASYVLVLRGRWPDDNQLTTSERRARGAEYWRWTSQLAEDRVLLAATDLRWEGGRLLEAGGTTTQLSGSERPDDELLVGMFALRVESYEQAAAVAASCPHLRYGGNVSVRRVGSGFVSTGFGDWR